MVCNLVELVENLIEMVCQWHLLHLDLPQLGDLWIHLESHLNAWIWVLVVSHVGSDCLGTSCAIHRSCSIWNWTHTSHQVISRLLLESRLVGVFGHRRSSWIWIWIHSSGSCQDICSSPLCGVCEICSGPHRLHLPTIFDLGCSCASFRSICRTRLPSRVDEAWLQLMSDLFARMCREDSKKGFDICNCIWNLDLRFAVFDSIWMHEHVDNLDSALLIEPRYSHHESTSLSKFEWSGFDLNCAGLPDSGINNFTDMWQFAINHGDLGGSWKTSGDSTAFRAKVIPCWTGVA